MAPKRDTRAKSAKPQPLLIKAYLILYNLASFLGWGYVLVGTLSTLATTGGDYAQVYGHVGTVCLWVQTAALLEVLHSLLGFVKSPIITTLIQVASRIMLVWGVVNLYPVAEVRQSPFYSSMMISWGVTECIRYAYYGLNLLGTVPSILLWCRYTFFYILYPTGAGSEAVLLWISTRFAEKLIGQWYYYFCWVVLATYPPGFYTMYTHMIGQRKRYLREASQTKKTE
ncbi:hypothetical protein BZG36_01543 [Bifiguratus adelaidae]|uniref:Very-long-chain (3R)-3-hydroxyacyl-CoA dehydratase n=1 Tax=Bifiguratus adelaidae TaxID=1938954 RepID=A0A261Y3X7_9FUNG|nr:hypothetical protein BZG36_01543 [Bifiguratus adelaidae]